VFVSVEVATFTQTDSAITETDPATITVKQISAFVIVAASARVTLIVAEFAWVTVVVAESVSVEVTAE